MTDDEKVGLIRQLHDQTQAAVLDGTELEFFGFLMEFFERQAKKNYYAGWTAAKIEGLERG
jgi:hypothetical protein